MEAKEKAIELLEKFSDLEDGEMYIEKAKQCALILVNEVVESLHRTIPNSPEEWQWKQVKKEIEKQ